MQDILVVIDMQNDFISGTLGSREAAAIVPLVVSKIKKFKGHIIFTRDTHMPNYLQTHEGQMLPTEHCIKGSRGWELVPEIFELAEDIIDKSSFGSIDLGEKLKRANEEEQVSSVTIIGVCTDICVISNAMIIQAFLPEAEIIIDASCCAGSTLEAHENALNAMKRCQIIIHEA